MGIRSLLAGWLVPLLLAAQGDQKLIFKDGVEAHRAGNFALAIQKYEEFLTQRPDVVQAWSNLGAALSRVGRYDEAIVKYHRALEMEPENSAIRLNLALAHYKRADFPKAIEELTIVLRIRASPSPITTMTGDQDVFLAGSLARNRSARDTQ